LALPVISALIAQLEALRRNVVAAIIASNQSKITFQKGQLLAEEATRNSPDWLSIGAAGTRALEVAASSWHLCSSKTAHQRAARAISSIEIILRAR